MNATMTASTMPALGVQLASMVGCVEACNRVGSSTDEDVSTWRQARNDVFEPFGLKYAELPAGPYAAKNGLNELIPQVCEKFDERVNRLYQVQVTKPVLDEQRIDVDMVKRAREIKLISELPANALIQSALTYGAQKEEAMVAERMSLSMLGNVGSVAVGLGSAIFAFVYREPAVGITGVMFAIALSTIITLVAKSESDLRKIESILEEKWHDIFPNKES